MSILLPNCYLSTARQQHNSSTGTSAMANATPVLTNVDGNARIITVNDYHTLPQAALQCEFVVKLAKGSDVEPGDLITSVVERDGTTPWMYSFDLSREYFSVALVLPTSPMLLEALNVYIMRQTLGGQAR